MYCWLVVEPYPSEKSWSEFVSWDDNIHSQVNMESHKIPWFQATNQTSIYRGYPIVMFDFHRGYHKKNHATWSIPRIGIRFITRIFSQYNPVHVVKTMSFLPPVTGNGKFIPTNFMVLLGDGACVQMALFLPTSKKMGKNEKKHHHRPPTSHLDKPPGS